VKGTFADAVYYLALLNVRDEFHDRAVAVTPGLSGRLVTSSWVLAEVADALSQPMFRSTVVELIEALGRDPLVTVVPASQELFDRGLELYADRPDKEWSLTDCISCIVMQDHGLVDVLTSDHHFEQMGFRTLLQFAVWLRATTLRAQRRHNSNCGSSS
jgi:uncharacterized protein